MMADRAKTNFEQRLAMAEATYGSIIRHSNNYLSKIKASGEDGSLLIIDRYLNLCNNQSYRLEFELNALFYGPLYNDERLLKLKSDLNSVLDELRTVKQDLTNKGYTNPLERFQAMRNTSVET